MKPISERTVRLSRQGNSTGVTLPKDLLDELGLERGDELAVSKEEDGSIRLIPAGSHRRRVEEAAERFGQRYARTLAKLAK